MRGRFPPSAWCDLRAEGKLDMGRSGLGVTPANVRLPPSAIPFPAPHKHSSALNAGDEALVMISSSCCDTTQTAPGEILATAKFADILALPRQNARRVHLQREHELGLVRIDFTVYEV